MPKESSTLSSGALCLRYLSSRASDGSAACGGKSDLSEWQRSAMDDGALPPRTFAGHRNRDPPSIVGAYELNFCVRDGCAPERCRWQKKRGGKQVPGSIADAAAPSARKISGTPNGNRWTSTGSH